MGMLQNALQLLSLSLLNLTSRPPLRYGEGETAIYGILKSNRLCGGEVEPAILICPRVLSLSCDSCKS